MIRTPLHGGSTRWFRWSTIAGLNGLSLVCALRARYVMSFVRLTCFALSCRWLGAGLNGLPALA